jgi:predicted PurR-regulated permease PerM
LLLLILFAAIVVAVQLYPFVPGLLGAVTLYILLRQWFFRITVVYNWKKWVAATMFISGALLVFVLPFLGAAAMIAPKVARLTANPQLLSNAISTITTRIHHFFPRLPFEETQLRGLLQGAVSRAPAYLNSTLQILTNLLLCFFLLYFMLISGRKMERRLQQFIALKDENITIIWDATRTMVVSNAIGIPVLAMAQALVATIGYYCFHIEGALLWGVLTGFFSMLPVIGTAIICVPLVAYLFATGHPAQAVGLGIYSVCVIGTVDNVLRFTLLRKLGDVHPVITVLGVIVGVPLFGFMGLIFGPLLISYFLLLIRIYQVEFAARNGA